MSLEIAMTESSGFDLHEPDEWYAGKLISIQETDPGKFGPKLKWVIQLDDEDYETWAFCYQKLSPKSKLYEWIKGLDPSDLPEPGDVVQFDKYLGKRIQVMFEQYEKDGAVRETPSKIRAEKKPAARTDTLSQKQGAAAKAKKPLDDDEAPF